MFIHWGKTLVPTKMAEETSLGKLNSKLKSNLLAETLEDLCVDAATTNCSFQETHEKMSVHKENKLVTSVAAALKIAPSARIKYLLATPDSLQKCTVAF